MFANKCILFQNFNPFFCKYVSQLFWFVFIVYYSIINCTFFYFLFLIFKIKLLFLYNLLQILNLAFVWLYGDDLDLIGFLLNWHAFCKVWSWVDIRCKVVQRFFTGIGFYFFFLLWVFGWDNYGILEIVFGIDIFPEIYSACGGVKAAFITFFILLNKFLFFYFNLFLDIIIC